jgi:hypothetical protein
MSTGKPAPLEVAVVLRKLTDSLDRPRLDDKPALRRDVSFVDGGDFDKVGDSSVAGREIRSVFSKELRVGMLRTEDETCVLGELGKIPDGFEGLLEKRLDIVTGGKKIWNNMS